MKPRGRPFLKQILFFVLLSTPLQAATYDPSLEWRTVTTEHFFIHYHKGLEVVAERMTVIAEEVYQILSERFDARPWGRTHLILADNHDAANGFATVLPYNHVSLRIASPTPDTVIGDYDEWLRELFTHEFTHIIHISDTRYPAKALQFLFGKLIAPNGVAPGWVVEGMATYFETVETSRGRGRSTYTDMVLRTDIFNDQFLHLDEMAGTQYSWPAWRAMYLYGVGFWQYLADTYGTEKITEFSHRYGRSLWLFSLNNKARKVFGKSFYELWAEWRAALSKRYASVREVTEKMGLREGESWPPLKRGESLERPLFSADQQKMIYYYDSLHHYPELRIHDLKTDEVNHYLRKKKVAQFDLAPDGESLVYARSGKHKRYYEYSDLHLLNLKTRKSKQLTKGKRVRDPDFSPDGKKIVCVVQETGRSRLAFFDLEKKEFEERPKLSEQDLAREYNNPRWSPDGKWVAVSIHEKGERDIWLINTENNDQKRITNDVAMDTSPAWGNGESVYFSSDRSGIPNIYRYDLASGHTSQITNVLTGAFNPTVSPDGQVAFQYYNGRGFEIRSLSITSPLIKEVTSLPPLRVRGEKVNNNSDSGRGALSQARSYSPFPTLLIPRYLVPSAAFIDNAFFFSATVDNFDPLVRHYWQGTGTFRSDNQFLGYDLAYSYNRFYPSFFAGSSFYSVHFGNITQTTSDYFEKRLRGFGGVSFPVGKQRFSLSYFFENRSEESGLDPAFRLLTLGHYAGVSARYRIASKEQTRAAISVEEGYSLTLNGELAARIFGTDENLEQQVFWGDLRNYLHLGAHHVIALRGAGGVTLGDELAQGNFGLGGSLGESPFAGSSTRVFTLRGLPLVSFSQDRAWVASAEYRIPLFYLERGFGTLPLAMNAGHMALFADLGDIYARSGNSFRPMLGVGAELRAEFVLGYFMPIQGRLGYGLIVTNRGRLGNLSDPLTGGAAQNGVLIVELGTSF
ncbi:MAG: PD40 domain-containing protein [Deltaproteobacteria bacterium]|nr:PD40 domain-containing protein [Deltaproteobacteria bacterium]